MSEKDVFLMIAPWTFVMVGLWWRGWAELTLRSLRDRAARHFDGNILTAGYREIMGVWNDLRLRVGLKRFLVAFFSLSMGVQTVILVSTFFGKQVIGMKSDQMLAG